MVALMGLLPGEFLFELCKFVLMLLLLVIGVKLGSLMRKKSDAKKEAAAIAAAKDEAGNGDNNITD